MKKILLIGSKGCGSAIAEAALALSKIPFDYKDLNYDNPEQREELLGYNPLGQVPALILDNGEILTESAAIVNYANLKNPAAKLIPSDEAENICYWRWACFLISAIYPTFTYGDDPEKWTDKNSSALLRFSTDEWRKKLWLQVEAEVGETSFLKKFSALDIYLGVMIYWRPRPDWFKENCPKIFSIASSVAARKELAPIWEKQFDSE